ncbi:MAG: ABC transporter permease [Bryobacteraceae bacterium]
MRIETFVQDLRYGARQLRLNPGFTTVAVLSLALGIGANTAIFELVDAVRLRSLPVRNPQELAYVDYQKGATRNGWFSTRSAKLTYKNWELIRTQQQAFSDTFAWSASRFNLADRGEARYAEGLYVSGDFFRGLGVTPILGHVLTSEDDKPGCGSPGAVIGYAFWQRQFGGDPNVLGRSVMLDGHAFPVVGVTPASFFGVDVGYQYDVAIPLCAGALMADDGKGRAPSLTAWWLSAMGRLKPGWTIQRASAQLRALSPGIMQASLPPTYQPDEAKKYLANKLEVTSGATGVSGLRRQYENPLWLLLATAGLVLLIACANLANLLLARASVREREIAVRQAIGAARSRLIAQLLAESLLLAVLGAALGAALAQILSRSLIAFLSTSGNDLFVDLSPDIRVFGFTATLAIATCLLFGLLPALRATRIAPASVMRASGRGLSAGRERFSWRRALVVSQVALSLVLLVGALLFVRSLSNALAVDPGFRAEGIIAVDMDFSRAHYSKARRPVVFQEMSQRLSAGRGILSAARTGFTPISGSGWNEMARPDSSGGEAKLINIDMISSGYFRTMGTALLAGRDFDQRDTLGSPKVAIVNEVFSKQLFGGANPVGRSFRIQAEAGKPDDVYQVVGFVRNTKYYDLKEDFPPIAFRPIEQDDDPGTDATYVLRTSGPSGDIMAGIKSAAAEVFPGTGLHFTVLTAQLKESLMRDRLMATLSGAFGLLAALLATLGLYGVIAFMVARRRNEIGVRMALGADRGSVVRLILREAGLLLAAGIVVGTVLALWAGRAASSLLFGLKPYDPSTIAGAVALLAIVALLASYAPARRAARLDPMDALREE